MNVHRLDEALEINPVEGFKARVVHGTDCTLAFWRVDAGAELPEHAHPHEQVLSVESGTFELTVAGETRTLGPGEVVPIPGDVPHGGKAITDCVLLDVFRPKRAEWV